MITEVAKFDEETRTVVPGADWLEAVEHARVIHRNSWEDYGHHKEFRTLGTLVGGAALLGEGDIDIQLFVDAAVPPLDQKETDNVRYGYNDVGRLTNRLPLLEGVTS